mgnify:FL=1
MRSDIEVAQAIERHADTVKRLCMIYLKNETDAEDIFQTVFLKYALHCAAFESPEHESAWMVRVTINACKDLLRSVFRRRTVPLDQVTGWTEITDSAHREVLEAVLSLPEKYRVPIYLHYYEGYTAPEIGKLTHRNVNTVYTLLNRGKRMLKEVLEDG